MAQKISFGVGINPEGISRYIWINSGHEADAMLMLFSMGWKEVNFCFENCEFVD